MNWVTIGDRHVNMDTVTDFWWKNGYLTLCYQIEGNDTSSTSDPNRAIYIKLCNDLGIDALEFGGDTNV